MRFSRGTGGSQPYANALNVNGCRINGNTDWGIYYEQGSGLYIRGCDIESNGTVNNTNTGGMFVSANIDDESGFAAIHIIDTWFESNKGHTFLMDAATNALLKMDTVQVYAQESTRAITVGTIRSAVFVNVLAPSTNATLTCSAETQFFAGNVFVYAVSTIGAVLVAGAYKTSTDNGTTWTATTGAIGTFETTVSFKTPFVKLTDGITVPDTEAGRATLFVDSSDGDLKIKFGDGTVKTIVVDT
jgi:hypothetical protein